MTDQEFSVWLRANVRESYRVPEALGVEDWVRLRRMARVWLERVGLRVSEVARLVGCAESHLRNFLNGTPKRPVYPLSGRLVLRLLDAMEAVKEPQKPWRPVLAEQFQSGRRYIPEDRVLVKPVLCPLCDELVRRGRLAPEEAYWWLPRGAKYCPGHRAEARRRSRLRSLVEAAERRLSGSGTAG